MFNPLLRVTYLLYGVHGAHTLQTRERGRSAHRESFSGGQNICATTSCTMTYFTYFTYIHIFVNLDLLAKITNNLTLFHYNLHLETRTHRSHSGSTREQVANGHGPWQRCVANQTASARPYRRHSFPTWKAPPFLDCEIHKACKILIMDQVPGIAFMGKQINQPTQLPRRTCRESLQASTQAQGKRKGSASQPVTLNLNESLKESWVLTSCTYLALPIPSHPGESSQVPKQGPACSFVRMASREEKSFKNCGVAQGWTR